MDTLTRLLKTNTSKSMGLDGCCQRALGETYGMINKPLQITFDKTIIIIMEGKVSVIWKKANITALYI